MRNRFAAAPGDDIAAATIGPMSLRPASSSPSSVRSGGDARRARITLVVARARNGVIGADGGLPWHLPEDLKHFRALTMGHAIVMGRRTWDSIGRALPGRRSIVVSRDLQRAFDGAERASSLDEAIAIASRTGADPSIATDEVFVIGGAQLFAAALPAADRAVVTEIDLDVEGDTYFDAIDSRQWSVVERREQRAANGTLLAIVDYRRTRTTDD
ncbi:MAG: dihydrofolate reductase [Burkholderiaceae bacterium]|nr:dihydrofolate reductase [Burkholderiaceae bacterium]